MFGIPLSRLMVTGVIASIIGIGSVFIVPQKAPEVAKLIIESSGEDHSVGETFTVTVKTEASEPVNVFKGLITFDPEIIEVTAIDYNTSLIDLWAKEPWYSNGDGTMGFIGGTTRSGGFTGQDTLLTVTFKAKAIGVAILSIKEIRILRHDGLGTDVVVSEPIDSLFSISEDEAVKPDKVVEKPDLVGPVLQVLPANIDTDLNHDGKQSIADTSIFMTHLVTQNPRSDFNQDGSVNLKDLSILNRDEDDE